MTATLLLLRGLPASGKSTFARAWVAEHTPGKAIRLNRDDLRRSLVDPNYRPPVYEVEQRITAVQRQAARDALAAGVSVVVDDTNLRLKYAREWATLAETCGAALEIRDFQTPVAECVARDARRTGVEQVGEQVIRDMHQRFVATWKGQWPTARAEAVQGLAGEPYVPPEDAPTAVIVDIDGTVALHEGVRSPYDPTKYHLDAPNLNVIEMVRRLEGARVVFCSGRDEDYRKATELWLQNNVGLRYDALFMRPSGDKRNDAVVKLEMFDKYVRDNYRILAVFDDRDRVVKMWRSIGLTVCQVAEGAF